MSGPVIDLDPVVPLPNVTRLLWGWAAGQAEVTALIGTAPLRLWTRLPAGKPAPSEPFLIARRTGGVPHVRRPLRFDSPRVDFHAYGGSDNDALRLAETWRAVLSARFHGLIEAAGERAVVDEVRWVLSPQDLADVDLEGESGGARPRYLTSAVFVLHLPHDAAG